MASEPIDAYPLTYDVEFPEQGVGQVSTFFRLFLLIRNWIVDGLLAGTTTLPLVVMLLFRKGTRAGGSTSTLSGRDSRPESASTRR